MHNLNKKIKNLAKKLYFLLKILYNVFYLKATDKRG